MRPYLGFVIPLAVTIKQGVRHSYPGPGICAECGKASSRTYIRWDDKPYCEECIKFDLASVNVDEKVEQRHPDTFPVEMVFDVMKVKGGTDDFELRAISAGTHPDPRMYDRVLP